MKRLVVTADDFGLSPGVNEAVERAARDGILTSASLMVAGPAAADAVLRARRLPALAVGLHLVLVEGPAMRPSPLTDEAGWLPSGQIELAFRYFFTREGRRALGAEIRAQFAAFARTGLTLDHANAHKHMHLHPTVGRMMIEIGREYGLRAIRVPQTRPGREDGAGERALRAWCGLLRRRARRAGLLTNDTILGLRETGRLTPARTQHLLDDLPDGLTEFYFHPATRKDALLARLMPAYDHQAEFQSLLAARLPAGVRLTSYGAEARPAPGGSDASHP